MTRYIADYKIVCNFDLPKNKDFNEVMSNYVRLGNWEPFGPPVLVSHNRHLYLAQALVIFEGDD